MYVIVYRGRNEIFLNRIYPTKTNDDILIDHLTIMLSVNLNCYCFNFQRKKSRII